jgi:branched-chain amino acid aminotransferase
MDELLNADEAFFTGTAAEIAPTSEVDGTTIGSGSRGPATCRIQEIVFAATQERDPNYTRWLHFLTATVKAA